MPDLRSVLFDYHGIPGYVRLSLGGRRLHYFHESNSVLEAAKGRSGNIYRSGFTRGLVPN
jgi:hypothetical protein